MNENFGKVLARDREKKNWTKKIFVLLIGMIFLGLNFGSVATADIDILGWQKIKWGMSKDEVLKIYKTKIDEDGMYISLNPFTIKEFKFTVIFIFDEKDKIMAVTLRHIKNESLPNLWAFKVIKNLLIKKYSAFSITDDDGQNIQHTWIKKSGTVIIGCYYSIIDAMYLCYQPKPEVLDKL